MGVEVEGEFTDALVLALERTGAVRNVKGDGSIEPCDECLDNNKYAREITTIPLAPDDEKLAKFFDVLERAWVRGSFHCNETMGFHIHTSFLDKGEKALPDEVASSPFAVSFAGALKRDWPREYRLRANNHYSKVIDGAEYDTSASIVKHFHSDAERYAFLNVQAFNRHGTLECRFWPSARGKKLAEYTRYTVAKMKDALAVKTLRADGGFEFDGEIWTRETDEQLVTKGEDYVREQIVTKFIDDIQPRDVLKYHMNATAYSPAARAATRRESIGRTAARSQLRTENINL